MEYLGCHTICYNAIGCDLTCGLVSLLVMLNRMLLCIDSSSLPYLLNLIRSSLTNRYNYLSSVILSELSLIPYSLFPVPYNYLDSDVLPFNFTWNMVKETPNHIQKNIIG